MTSYILRRLAQMVPLLLGISVVLFGVIQAAPGGPEAARLQPVVLRAARLMVGRCGPPLAPGIVVVTVTRISAVGSELPVPASATWEEELVTITPGQAALYGARNAYRTLPTGCTTVRDMGPKWPWVDVDLKDAVEKGVVPPGPA